HVKLTMMPVNNELTINSDILFADRFIDLLSFDISDLNNVQLVGRKENAFSVYNNTGLQADPDKGILTSWERKEQHIEIAACDVALQPWGGFYFVDGIAVPHYAAKDLNSMAAFAPGTCSGTCLVCCLSTM